MSGIKNKLRIQCKKRRNSYYKHSNNTLNAEAFIKSRFYKDYDSFLLYVSFGSEPDTYMIIRQALTDNKTVYLPKVNGDTMSFFNCKTIDNLQKGCFGIPEPLFSDNAYNGENAVCVVPGLAFDQNGYRLGYGKGYYDRFLSKNKDLITVGFCSGCNFSEKIPIDKNDVPVKYIFVDDKLIDI